MEFCFKSWKWAAKKSYNPTRLVITFNSRHYDMTSIERYIGQSTIAFTVETELKVTECALDVHMGCTPFVID